MLADPRLTDHTFLRTMGIRRKKRLLASETASPQIDSLPTCLTTLGITPQPKQAQMLDSEADIVIFGGAAYAGKTMGLLLDPLHHIANRDFGATIFRRTFSRITVEGGMWDETKKLYQPLQAKPNSVEHAWTFPSGASINFAHLQHAGDEYAYYGAQICVLGFDQLEEFCLHPETEVLTAQGWRPITDVRRGDLVASLTADRQTVYLPVSETVRMPCRSGKLITVYQPNGISFRATPQHRVPVASQRGDGAWKFKQVKDLKHDRILRTGHWRGHEVKRYQFWPVSGRGLGRNANAADSVAMDLWLRFLGWWFSEGGTYLQSRLPQSQTPFVHLCQTGPYAGEIEKMLTEMPFRFTYNRKTGMFWIASRQLYDELAPLGNTYTKRIPRWIFQLSPRQMRLFFEAFMKGDGSPCGAGFRTGLANEGLIDDLQEMAFLLGLVATKASTQSSTSNALGKRYPVWQLGISRPERTRGTIVDRHHFEEEPYDGDVYCLTVPGTHTFLARHRGRYFWSGNSSEQFFYMITRNRSTCGVKPYCRATCNPEPDSWLATFLEWWIDKQGDPIPERAGLTRYLIRSADDSLVWGDTVDELYEHYGSAIFPKSVCFIPGTMDDNPIGRAKDPAYEANLMLQPGYLRQRLRFGNWKAKPTAGEFFKEHWFAVVDLMPGGCQRVRFWDLAATEPTVYAPDPDFTVGVLEGLDPDGYFYYGDVQRDRVSSGRVERMIMNTAEHDGHAVAIGIEQEPGASGKITAYDLARKLAAKGFKVWIYPKRVKTELASGSLASAAELGSVYLVRGPWNEPFLNELVNFPGAKHDDQVVAATGAHGMLTKALKGEQVGYGLVGMSKVSGV
jgi:predicted phage terminase large subunit-like protein